MMPSSRFLFSGMHFFLSPECPPLGDSMWLRQALGCPLALSTAAKWAGVCSPYPPKKGRSF